MNIFHRKILRGILNFSRSSSIPALYFLLGELPIEGQIHRDVFSLFYSVWTNPKSKIFSIVKYLVENCPSNSRTWSNHVKFLSLQYQIPDPLECLNNEPPNKTYFKEFVLTKVCAYHENNLRQMAVQNSRMKYLNVSLLSLRGKSHPALNNIVTIQDVRKCRPHLKMLSGDYLTFQDKANHSGRSPSCKTCKDSSEPDEDLCHILTKCTAYTDIRSRILQEYYNLFQASHSKYDFSKVAEHNETLCQFLLDPSSLNLSERISMNNPILVELFKHSRDLCFSINNRRTEILKTLQYLLLYIPYIVKT